MNHTCTEELCHQEYLSHLDKSLTSPLHVIVWWICSCWNNLYVGLSTCKNGWNDSHKIHRTVGQLSDEWSDELRSPISKALCSSLKTTGWILYYLENDDEIDTSYLLCRYQKVSYHIKIAIWKFGLNNGCGDPTIHSLQYSKVFTWNEYKYICTLNHH